MSSETFNIPTPGELRKSRQAEACVCGSSVCEQPNNKKTWNTIVRMIAGRIAQEQYKATTLADGTIVCLRFDLGRCTYESLNNNEAHKYISGVFEKHGWNRVRIWYKGSSKPLYFLGLDFVIPPIPSPTTCAINE